MIAAGWTWPAAFVVVAIVVTFGFVATASMASRFSKGISVSGSAVSSRRLEAIEEDLGAIRADLADIKESLAELDRMFKSVG